MEKYRGVTLGQFLFLFLFFCFFQFQETIAQSPGNDRFVRKVKKKLEKWDNPYKNWNYLGKIKIDSLSVSKEEKKIQLFFSKGLSYVPVREGEYKLLNQSVIKKLGCRFRKYSIDIYT